MNENKDRILLKDFLIYHLNKKDISGLEWVDQNEKIFRILWKHKGKQDWKVEDSEVFWKWAKSRNRLDENSTSPSLKSRFRCALNKAQDIIKQEMDDKRDNENWKYYKIETIIKINEKNKTDTILNTIPYSKNDNIRFFIDLKIINEKFNQTNLLHAPINIIFSLEESSINYDADNNIYTINVNMDKIFINFNLLLYYEFPNKFIIKREPNSRELAVYYYTSVGKCRNIKIGETKIIKLNFPLKLFIAQRLSDNEEEDNLEEEEMEMEKDEDEKKIMENDIYNESFYNKVFHIVYGKIKYNE